MSRLVHALVVHTDGRISEQQIRGDDAPESLTSLQERVGGCVEYVALTPGAGLYCNDSGLLDDLPHNDLATRVAARLRPDLSPTLALYGLRGDVVFLGTTAAGNSRDCPRAIADMLRAAATGQGSPR